MRRLNCPPRSTSIGIALAGSSAAPSTSTRCSPTRSRGSWRARRTASAAAGAPTIRLAAVRMPCWLACCTASLTAWCSPKSSAVTIRKRPDSGGVGTQEAKELHALAQPPLGHLPAGHHLGGQFGDLAWTEIEAEVERLHSVVDVLGVQMRVADRR